MTDRQILMRHLGEMLSGMFRDSLSLTASEYFKLWDGDYTLDEDDPHFGQVWRTKYWDRVSGCLKKLAELPLDEPVEMDEIAWNLRGLCPRLFNKDGSRTELTFEEACSNA